MAKHVALLARNATKWELLVSDVNDELARLGDPFDSIRVADVAPPSQFLPWLVYEYGLGELSPYLPNLYSLISEGVQWQRVRGTPAAIARGLSWLAYAATLEEEPTRHKRWNRFQIMLDRVRDTDLPDLRQIEGIVGLSAPLRSKFLRGFRGYDIRAAETSYQKTSASLVGDHSGVRIPGGVAKWSFGRLYTADRTIPQATLEALDAWIAPVSEGDLWVDANYLWSGASFLWHVPAAQARRLAIAQALVALRPLIRFSGASGVIGYARANLHPVSVGPSGYTIAGTPWKVDPVAPTAVLAFGSSGFGDGAGQTATSLSVVLGAALDDDVPPGRLWLEPGDITGGTVVASTTVNVPLGLTVRERAQFLLRF